MAIEKYQKYNEGPWQIQQSPGMIIIAGFNVKKTVLPDINFVTGCEFPCHAMTQRKTNDKLLFVLFKITGM